MKMMLFQNGAPVGTGKPSGRWVGGTSSFFLFRSAIGATCALVVFFCVAGRTARASERVENAILQARQDVESAAQALVETRKRVSNEKLPLATELSELSAEIEANRLKARRIENVRLQREAEQTLLKREVNRLADDFSFINAAVSEYRRATVSRASMPELQVLLPDIEEIDENVDGPSATADALALLLETAEKWNTRRVGGYSFEGACLDSNGAEHFGKFMVFGPAVYFTASAGDVRGPAIVRHGSLLPGVFDRIDDAAGERIAMLAVGGEITVPVDVTDGAALKAGASGKTFLEHVRDGGIVMIPIILIGALAAMLVVFKSVWLLRTRVDNAAPDKITALLVDDRVQEAERFAFSLRPPLNRVLLEGIRHRNAHKEQREEVMSETLLACQPEMERHLGTLAVFGAVAPLLGLLGTVTGMIHTFRLVTIFGTGDARQLSGGISEALVTTVAGLLVAIPVLLAHAFLARGVRNRASEIEAAIIRFVGDDE